MVKNLDDYQVSEDAFNLRDLLERTKTAVEGIYAQYNVPLPTRRYWTMGRPAEDCEQMAVSFIQLYLGAPGDQAVEAQHCNVAPRSAVLEISVTRPYTIGNNGKAPATSEIEKSSDWTAVDAWILMESVNVFDNWDGLGLPGLGVIATVSANDPSGGLQTVVMNLTVAVP